MAFRFGRKPPLVQCESEAWKQQWQSLVPPECRNVPITLGDETVIAFVQVNQFVMMLQDGLLMEASFFNVCEFFQRAGYHVIWLMRCTQDLHHGYVRHRANGNGGLYWTWKKPTTNFGRWTSDNFHATILLQHEQLPSELQGQALQTCERRILQRVVWAESDDPTRMIPHRTNFQSVGSPATPAELLKWLNGVALSRAIQNHAAF